MPPPPPPRRCRPGSSMPALMDELIEEILIRIPPDEPAHLVRAAVVCKPWRRMLTDRAGFLRRYRAFHGAPPLLGYLHNLARNNPARIPPLALTSAVSPLVSAQPQPALHRSTYWALDCRHGRVLIHFFAPQHLVVWDPVTGGQKELSVPDYDHCYYAGAVLCAVDGCDHLDCHDGPFLVVFAGSTEGGGGYDHETWAAVYSSETGAWSPRMSVDDDDYICSVASKPSLLIGDTLYFSTEHGGFLKCDLGAHELSPIEPPKGIQHRPIAMEIDGGGLGIILQSRNCICIWSWQADGNDDASIGRWEEHKVIELESTLLPAGSIPFCSPDVVGLLEGTYTIFINVDGLGVFTLDLKSGEVKKVGERGSYYTFLPYTSFYTPDIATRRPCTVTSTKML